MATFNWLLEPVPAATPTTKGVAVGVARTPDDSGRQATPVDDVPHLLHLPHREISEAAERADLLADLTERAAILEHDAGLDRKRADALAVRIVQCSTCRHWTPDPLGGNGIGTCATGADSRSWSAWNHKPPSAWPNSPRHCTEWRGADDS